jgi:hypothetical protein
MNRFHKDFWAVFCCAIFLHPIDGQVEMFDCTRDEMLKRIVDAAAAVLSCAGRSLVGSCVFKETQTRQKKNVYGGKKRELMVWTTSK